MGFRDYGGWRPYVSVATRRGKAKREADRARKAGKAYDPVEIEGRKIAKTAWGLAWCEHCEGYQDYENRLPRGRTYVRNGSVIDLQILEGEIRAKVFGSELYEQVIEIKPCNAAVWKRVKTRCAGRIGSLIELLEGRISGEVMALMMAEQDGILPELSQVSLACSCPDWSRLCKHLAAVLYGVGARLDERPELLFKLRGLDPKELVDSKVLAVPAAAGASSGRHLEGDLSSVFGIDLAAEPSPGKPPSGRTKAKAKAKTKAGTRARVEAAAAPSETSPAKRESAARPKRDRSPAAGLKKQPRKNAATKRPSTRAQTVTRQALLSLGVAPGSISSWVRDGLLERTTERGVYRHTRESRSRLKDHHS